MVVIEEVGGVEWRWSGGGVEWSGGGVEVEWSGIWSGMWSERVCWLIRLMKVGGQRVSGTSTPLSF